MSHTIELKKVSKYYASEDSVSMGFSRIDLELDMGEFVAITGESGSGKSTLLNVISGLDTYEEGEMFVCGEDTSAYGTADYERYRKKYIGNIFQDFNLINSYTVYQNIEVVMLLAGVKGKERKARILELINKVGLSKYRRTKVSKLSGGQKQRVAIARALAKDAPIIVADEPTGNLDSESAESVMETLSKVAADKLVVIVTHNYEQAEPYVTRKLTMHDGKIIEDKKIERTREEGAQSQEGSEIPAGAEIPAGTETAAVAAAASGRHDQHRPRPRTGRMSMLSELRLGMRNTFNLPAKFLLLFIVYFFVSSAVLGQYASARNSMHQEELLGTTGYFTDNSSDRIIIKRADEKALSEEDIQLVNGMDNIRSVVVYDPLIDSGLSISVDDYYIEGGVHPISEVKESDLTYGSMPENDYDIVIRMDSNSDSYYAVEEAGEDLIGRKVKLTDLATGMQRFQFAKPVRIAGIVVDDAEKGNVSVYGYSTICVSDKMASRLMVSTMASMSKITLDFGGTKIDTDDGSLYSSPRVPEGKVYIFDDQAYNYKDGKAIGKNFAVNISNRFFKSEAKFTVAQVLTTKNIYNLLGVSKDEYDMYYNAVYINDKDFNKLFNKGPFQISAYMENEADSDATEAALKEAGFSPLVIKKTYSNPMGAYTYIFRVFEYCRLAAVLIVLFFIAYAVIRLIMRSRDSYYTTLRILGATRSNTSSILRTELVFMMALAYAADLVLVFLVSKGYLKVPELSNLLYYLTPVEYAVLAAVLLIMSLLIANRYSRKIFTRSAMKAFREGA